MCRHPITFKYLIVINPLGFMYGSAGAFLSPENLVGRAGAKFPPEAATLAGLFFSANKINNRFDQEELRYNLYVSGPFWAKSDYPEDFYVPIPWSKVISQDGVDEWRIENGKWERNHHDLEPDYHWQQINYWHDTPEIIQGNGGVAETPWKYVPILHPRTKDDERCVRNEDGLFLENTVQMSDETCLVYLSSHELPEGWYRFGGENHLVEITSIPLSEDSLIIQLLSEPIKRAFALITPGVWGSNTLSYRYPKHPDFTQNTKKRPLMLTDRPIPYRYRAGGKMGRGRYAVPPGTVYVFPKEINKTWGEWSEDWFPKEGFSLKQLGCNLCLPIKISGVDDV